ncbi:hypothetical protein G5T42_02840 [Microbacterium sp. 4R-513]|uniref:hypothetical protein n=1 Tax=Microbacterium sp. 4R-513 TaxID=2567934 RepID=UPI0013E1F78C|nr:hypothetical protein [Microbacterium sp. 4R-513]QIG38548.1 hypothetical protein G5T42_02840 [Microbacterium sp. 4R-513]
MEQQREIFAVGRGQYENIGDIILRRPLLDWAREAGRLHVYVGESPDGYDEGLGLRPEDRVYRSFAQWYAALVKAAVAGNAHSIYKPGEVQLTVVGMKEHVAMLPAATLVRLRGGKVARIGVGSRNFAPLPRAIMWPSNALSSYTRWRDDRTAAYLGFGPAMPDLGFSDGMGEAELEASIGPDAPVRDLLVPVAARRHGGRTAPLPRPRLVRGDEGCRGAAGSHALRRHAGLGRRGAVAPARRRSRRRARGVGPPRRPRRAGGAPAGVYRRTAVAASDRLHVIIGAFTEGAAPVGLQLDDSDKIARHFSTIGIEGVAVNTTGLTSAQISDRVLAIAGRRAEQIEQLLIARERLSEVRSDLQRLLGPVRAEATAGVS